MSAGARKPYFVHKIALLMSFIFLLQILIIFYPGGDIAASGEEEPTRSGEIEIDMDAVPNFDIQFMIEPDDDILSEFRNLKWSRMCPGSEGIYWVMIANMGPINDTYHLRLAEPHRNNGWNWYFYDTRSLEIDVHLTSPHIRDKIGGGGPSFKAFRIKVEAPIDASHKTRFPLRVSAISDSLFSDVYDRAYEDHDEMMIVIVDIHYLRIEPNYPKIYYVDQTEYVTIELPLTNLGNKDILTVDLKVIEDNFWMTSYRHFEQMYTSNYYRLDFNWTERTVDIPQGETVWLELKARLDPIFGGDEDSLAPDIYDNIINYLVV